MEGLRSIFCRYEYTISKKQVLSRYDSEGDYTKDNCYWKDILNPDIDVMNYRTPEAVPEVITKSGRYFLYKGEVNNVEGFAKKYGADFTEVSKKMARGWGIERAIKESLYERKIHKEN